MMKTMMSTKILRCYDELLTLKTFKERFDYLYIGGQIGVDTFGFDRVFNQMFYKSTEWQSIRNYVITRDLGCDLAVADMEVSGRICVHHMNPVTIEDIRKSTNILLNPDFLITAADLTHKAIHYGGWETLPKEIIERTPFDTCPWKRQH